MRRITSIIAVLGLAIAGFLISAAPAEARGDGGDNRPCVTRREYNTSKTSWTVARMARYYDTQGSRWGYWQGGEYIEDGYWEDVWVDDGYWDIDEFGNEVWVDDGYWDVEWVEDTYWERNFEDEIIQRYRKCGRWGVTPFVYINFDNYYFHYTYGLRGWRAYAGNPNRPRPLIQWTVVRGVRTQGGHKAPAEPGRTLG